MLEMRASGAPGGSDVPGIASLLIWRPHGLNDLFGHDG